MCPCRFLSGHRAFLILVHIVLYNFTQLWLGFDRKLGKIFTSPSMLQKVLKCVFSSIFSYVLNPFMPGTHNNIKPPHTDLYRLDVRNVMSAPVDGRKLTFGTSCWCERVNRFYIYFLWKTMAFNPYMVGGMLTNQ